MFQKLGLRTLRSQLIFTFILGFLGIGIAIGLPVILLISRQASSQAQLLLDQAVVASRAFIESEQSDLQSLALLISQRPTLTRLLQEQNSSSLEGYLDTLRQSANLDLMLICSDGKGITEFVNDNTVATLCQSDSQSGYAAPTSNGDLYLYASTELASIQQPVYRVIVGKRASSILTELQNETGLLYFLSLEDRALHSSEASIEITPELAASLRNEANQDTNLSLQQRSGRDLINGLVDMPFAVSPVVAGYMLLLLFGRNGALAPVLESLGIQVAFALPGMVLATLFVTLPFMIRELIPVLEAFDTRQEQAAATLGANGWQTFWRVAFPSLRWGLIYGVTTGSH